MPRTTGLVGPNGTADGSDSVSHLVGNKQDQGGDLHDESGLSEIEQLMKGKKFTRQVIVVNFLFFFFFFYLLLFFLILFWVDSECLFPLSLIIFCIRNLLT